MIKKNQIKNYLIKNFLLTLVILGLSVLIIFMVLPIDKALYVWEQTEIVIKDAKGNTLYAPNSISYSHFQDIPATVVETILSLEDRRFRNHYGIDLRAVARAFYENMRAGQRVQWASTIDQQLVKLHESAYHRSYLQKIKEIVLALKLNIYLTKQELFLGYVNHLSFPYGVQWIAGGCQLYFGKDCGPLSQHQLLFVLSSAQLWNNPFREQEFKITKRRALFLCRVLKGEIGNETTTAESQCEDAVQQTPVVRDELAGKQISEMPHILSFFLSSDSSYKSWSAPSSAWWPLPTTLTTQFDTLLFRRIENIIDTTYAQRASVDANDCCVVVLDGNGELVSMNVCRKRTDTEAWQVNGCLAKRQTWSAIKPFVYMYAMHKLWVTSQDTIVDEPVSYQLDEESLYTPQNFDLKYHGKVTLAQALGNSLNIPAVRMLHDAGVDGFVDFMKDIRTQISKDAEEEVKNDTRLFSADRQGLSLALWTYEMSPYVFAKLRKVRFVKENTGNDANRFITTYNTQIQDLSQVLQDPQNRLISFGQENYLNVPGWIVKTGTSRHFVDGRVCGAHQQKNRIVCVWMWNYDAKPLAASSVTTAGYLRRLVVDAVH